MEEDVCGLARPNARAVKRRVGARAIVCFQQPEVTAVDHGSHLWLRLEMTYRIFSGLDHVWVHGGQAGHGLQYSVSGCIVFDNHAHFMGWHARVRGTVLHPVDCGAACCSC